MGSNDIERPLLGSVLVKPIMDTIVGLLLLFFNTKDYCNS